MEFENIKNSDLVSIIIPAYNVDKYIDKCILSIQEQSYQNIEIIIINDGSTDNTKEIINKLLNSDQRIRVIHTSNLGVSSARNRGIKESNGNYLIFVDGDDYLANDCVFYMLNLIKSTSADFCLSQKCYTEMYEKQVGKEIVSIINSEEATAMLLSPDIIVGCWNKIYKRSIILDNEIRFSEDLFYGEGLTFIIDVAQACNAIGVGNKKVYYYRKNNEKSATTEFDIKKIYNGEKSLINIRKQLPTGSKKIDAMYYYHLSLYRLGALVSLKSHKLDKVYFNDYNRWLRYIRENFYKFILCKELSIYRKLLITAGSISPFVVSRLDKIRRQRIIDNSVDD